ncbi:MAG: ATP-dependent exoDNAse [Verrucomicrobiota bacterium]
MGLTSSQLDAVQARGNVIVVAGAGTGKTSTLVERVASLLAEGVSVERLLMVTFTDAAAAEMRHRLRVRLEELAATSASAEQERWEEQLALLDTARIGTLHSFCLQLIRENFHLLGIDPAVSVLDDQQTRPLIEKALDECLAPHFAGADATSAAVREVIRRYAGGDPEQIRGLILKLHRRAQTLPSPEQWFAEQLAAVEQEQPESWRAWLAVELKRWAEQWLPELEAVASEAENLARCARAVRVVRETASTEVAAALDEISAADAAEWPKKQKTKLREPFKKFFEEAEFLASQFEAKHAGDGLTADWQNVRGGLAALLVLAREFGAKFAVAKRDLGGLDFGDLEQFTLRLLIDSDGAPSPVARACRDIFEHIFVDECQDINAAQDAIIAAVSRTNAGHGNRFLVGDVKQSIYQFRLAKPKLFLEYEMAWQTGADGRRISLVDNFRSHSEVITFVNELFAPLMREGVGGVAYEALAAGRLEPTQVATANGKRVEFCLLCKTEETEGEAADGEEEVKVEDLQAVEREARTVALRLREMHETGLVIFDKELKRHRRVEWRDMAVLLRSPRNRVEAFAKEFHNCGVPLQAERGGFLDSTEVSDLLSLVRLLDNTLQDIPLLAVLRSPLVAMTLDELAQIRIASKAKRLWAAVKEFHHVTRTAGKSNEPTLGFSKESMLAWRKVDWFLQRFAVWRELARQASLSQCLERALADSHYEAVTQAGERGAERVANVRKFIALVRQYDPYQRQGLFRFLQFIEALQAAEQEIEPAPALAQNAVRLMSIHKSKGLEFPVVVVACLGTRFNASDQSEAVLVDEDYGVCAKAVASSGGKHPTFAHWVAARRQRRQLLGEELRLLYVAMTRARDHLILSGSAQRKAADEWEADLGRAFADREILKVQSMLDWILLWLPRVTTVEELGRDDADTALLRWRIVRDVPELPAMERIIDPLANSDSTVGDVAGALMQRIEWRYPHATAVDVGAKTTVTALRRRTAELVDEDAGLAAFAKPSSRAEVRVTATTGLDAASVGTLHHEFLQALTLEGAGNETGLRLQLEAMVAGGLFDAESAAAIDLKALAFFWNGEIGDAIRENAAAVRRELPFTARFTPVELQALTGVGVLAGMENESVVVQGVADLVVILTDEIWLLDFKTDRVRPEGLAAKIEAYRPQLRIYAAALQKIYGKPVRKRWLHFIAARHTESI